MKSMKTPLPCPGCNNPPAIRVEDYGGGYNSSPRIKGYIGCQTPACLYPQRHTSEHHRGSEQVVTTRLTQLWNARIITHLSQATIQEALRAPNPTPAADTLLRYYSLAGIGWR